MDKKEFRRRMKSLNPCISKELHDEILKNPEKCKEIVAKERIASAKIHKIVFESLSKLFTNGRSKS